MANEEHLARLLHWVEDRADWQGVEAWNLWRAAHPDIEPDLSEVDLSGLRNLSRANLSRANLSRTFLMNAQLFMANLEGANLSKADLEGANLTSAYLTGADLSGANLTIANLNAANLSQVNLRRAQLVGTLLLETNFEGANLTGCQVYGISVWNVNLTGAQQSDLVITPANEPVITVDNLEVAQFIYLLLHNEKIRQVIDTITSKAVLILGRFTPERKAVLDAIREEIRRRNLLPIMFDFTPSASRTTLETVSTLSHIARFVIVDLTDAKSVLQELQAIVPNNPSVPVQPILLASQEEPGMFDFFRRYAWVLETYRYHSLDEVLASLPQIIACAEQAKDRSGTVSA